MELHGDLVVVMVLHGDLVVVTVLPEGPIHHYLSSHHNSVATFDVHLVDSAPTSCLVSLLSPHFELQLAH
jgi:hypothetical protein